VQASLRARIRRCEGCDLIRLRDETEMSDLFWLTDEQMERLQRFFLKAAASLGAMTAGS
jgi:hypothetical protein